MPALAVELVADGERVALAHLPLDAELRHVEGVVAVHSGEVEGDGLALGELEGAGGKAEGIHGDGDAFVVLVGARGGWVFYAGEASAGGGEQDGAGGGKRGGQGAAWG